MRLRVPVAAASLIGATVAFAVGGPSPAAAGTTAPVVGLPAFAAILNRAPRPIPAALTNTAEHDSNLLIGQAKVVRQSTDGTLWLVPGRDGQVCFGIEPSAAAITSDVASGHGALAFGYTCSAPDDASRSGVAFGYRGSEWGLVPDGVATVQVDPGTGTPTPTAVSGHTFQIAKPVGGLWHGAVAVNDAAGASHSLTIGE